MRKLFSSRVIKEGANSLASGGCIIALTRKDYNSFKNKEWEYRCWVFRTISICIHRRKHCGSLWFILYINRKYIDFGIGVGKRI